MATMEWISRRVDGKDKEIVKLTKKLERINKAKASGWKDNPYYYDERDLKYTIRDLEEAKQAREKYLEMLAAEVKKSESRNVPAILNFLEAWKTRMTDFYREGFEAYYAEHKQVRALGRECNEMKYGSPERKAKEAEWDAAHKALRNKLYGYFMPYEVKQPTGRIHKGERKVREGEYEHLRRYITGRTMEEAMKKLTDDLKREADRKYDFIIDRTVAIVGTITDASGLSVGEKEDLNGIIIGTEGKAKITTIGAGGYNIQCFHFRTLINRA